MRRPKSFWRLWLRGWGWVALIALVPALVFVPMWAMSARTAERLETEGVEAVAEVTDKRIRRSGDERDHYVYYSFTTAQGIPVEDRQDVSIGFFNATEIGDRIPVRYWQGDPSMSEVEAGAAAATRTIGMVGAVVSLAVFLFAGGKAWSRARAARWLAENGFPRKAQVTAVVDTNVTVNDVRHWRAVWREADGREGTTRGAPRDSLPDVGDEITIYVDPDGRRPSVWEGDVTQT